MLTRLKSDLILLLVAFIWGSSFAAQRAAAPYVGPFLFNASRFLLGAFLLLILLRFKWGVPKGYRGYVLAAGFVIYLASTLQQAGMQWTTAGNAGFLTTLYVVLVPLMLWLLFRRRISWVTWMAVALAVGGAWLLSSPGALTILPGDGLEIIGAFFWAAHVVIVDQVANRVDTFQFAAGQFAVAGMLNLLTGLIFESATLPGLAITWGSIVYVGVLSTAIAYTLQIVGQKGAPPADAALILSLEAVFAALFGWLTLGENLAPIQLLGCGLIMGAVLLVQWNNTLKARIAS